MTNVGRCLYLCAPDRAIWIGMHMDPSGTQREVVIDHTASLQWAAASCSDAGDEAA